MKFRVRMEASMCAASRRPSLSDFLTLRMGSVCELTTAVYVSAATVSRVFCFEAMSMKSLSVNGFTDMDRMETA